MEKASLKRLSTSTNGAADGTDSFDKKSQEELSEMDSGISADSNSYLEDGEGEVETVESDWKYWNQEVHDLLNDAWVQIRDHEVEGSQDSDRATTMSMSARSCWSLTTEDEETSMNGSQGHGGHRLSADFGRSDLTESEICQSEPVSSACSSSFNSTVIIYDDDIEISEESQVCVDALNETLMSTYRLNYDPPFPQEPLMFWTEQEFAVIKEFVRLFPAVYPSLVKLQFAENPDPEYSKEKYAELEAEYNNFLGVLQNDRNTSDSDQQFHRRPDTSSDSDLSMTTEDHQVDDSEPAEPLDPEPLCNTPPTEDFPPFHTTSKTQQSPSPNYNNSNHPETTSNIIRPIPVILMRQQRPNPTVSHSHRASQYGSFPVPQFSNQSQQNCYFQSPIQPQPYYYYAHSRPWHANTVNTYNGHHWTYKYFHCHYHYDSEMAMLNYNFSRSLRLRRQLNCYNYNHFQLQSFPQNRYERCTKKSYSPRPSQMKRRNRVKAVKTSSSSSASSTQSVEESEMVSEALPLSNEQKNSVRINENLALQDQQHFENYLYQNVAVAGGFWNTVTSSSSRKWIGLSVVLAILIVFSVGLHVTCNCGCSEL